MKRSLSCTIAGIYLEEQKLKTEEKKSEEIKQADIQEPNFFLLRQFSEAKLELNDVFSKGIGNLLLRIHKSYFKSDIQTIVERLRQIWGAHREFLTPVNLPLRVVEKICETYSLYSILFDYQEEKILILFEEAVRLIYQYLSKEANRSTLFLLNSFSYIFRRIRLFLVRISENASWIIHPTKPTLPKKSRFLEEHTIASFTTLAEEFVNPNFQDKPTFTSFCTSDSVFEAYCRLLHPHCGKDLISKIKRKITNPLVSFLVEAGEHASLSKFKEYMAPKVVQWKKIVEKEHMALPKLCCRICEKEYPANVMVKHTELCLEKSAKREEFKKIDNGLLDLGEELTRLITDLKKSELSNKQFPMPNRKTTMSKNVFEKFAIPQPSSIVRKLPCVEQKFSKFPEIAEEDKDLPLSRPLTTSKTTNLEFLNLNKSQRVCPKTKSNAIKNLLSFIPDSVKKKRQKEVKKKCNPERSIVFE